MTIIENSATVYGVILNDVESLSALGSLDMPPYKGAPKAPVMYIKPSNTHVPNGGQIRLPQNEFSVEIGATIGLVIGRDAKKLSPKNAMEAVSGMVLAADLSLPHSSYYRPAIREKCFDGALPLSKVEKPEELTLLSINTGIDDELIQTFKLSNLIRSPSVLLSDVTEFMTLRKGDVLLLGVQYQAPQAKIGSEVRISCAGFEDLKFSLAALGDAS